MRLALRAVLLGLGLVLAAVLAAQFGSPDDSRNDRPKPGASLELLAAPPPEVAEILRKACYDCHSAETRWPWYSHLPVIGTELQKHVTGGRTQLDLTDWKSHIEASEREDKLESMCIQAKSRKMPLPQYLILHPQSRLSDAEVGMLCRWTDAERLKSE